mmetsp:Transcript_22245/g.46205  ORF Transcript_22245/g.46205 Transcript_22245/m.46205 type:complete len:185 (+) Transcript_22245:2176-2730(+)
MSSSWDPASRITLPLTTEVPSGLPRTTMTSALRTVVSLWAMTIVVLLFSPSINLSRAVWTTCSEMLSRAEVASSRIRMGGLRSRARAIATRCFSPPESFPPLGPTTVLYPSGKLLMNSCALAFLAASIHSWSEAPGFPILIFSMTLVSKRRASWETTPMWERRDVRSRSFMSIPSRVMVPPVGS